jgi:hypothetical protein
MFWLGKDKEVPAFNIPDIREYFLDLEYVLGVIADGPTKSFAFRRLRYLSSKFTMYTLLNDFQELADMKVSSSPSSTTVSDHRCLESAAPVSYSFIFIFHCLMHFSVTSIMFARLTRMSIIQAA